jgi:phosphatidylserine decarboxylase
MDIQFSSINQVYQATSGGEFSVNLRHRERTLAASARNSRVRMVAQSQAVCHQSCLPPTGTAQNHVFVTFGR